VRQRLSRWRPTTTETPLPTDAMDEDGDVRSVTPPTDGPGTRVFVRASRSALTLFTEAAMWKILQTFAYMDCGLLVYLDSADLVDLLRVPPMSSHSEGIGDASFRNHLFHPIIMPFRCSSSHRFFRRSLKVHELGTGGYPASRTIVVCTHTPIDLFLH
jgi:hypothetical protein